MRLYDLDGSFIGNVAVDGKTFRRQDGIVGAQGVMFQCPKCAIGLERGEENGRRFVRGAHYAIVLFLNPQDAAPVPKETWPQIARWTMTGTSLEDLTTRPSILFSGPGCGWHGWLTNGDLHE